MDLPQAPDRASAGSATRADDLSRVPRRWLALARTIWIVVTILAVTLFVVSLPAYYDLLRISCTGNACLSHQLTPEGMRSLRELGLSVGFYATYSVVVGVFFTGVCLAIAAVIFWRAPRERMALLGALMLVLFGVIFPEVPRALVLTHPLWYWPVSGVAFLGFVSVILFINLFPGGRFVPRWTRWAALIWIIAAGQGIFFPDSTERHWVSLLNTLGFACAAGASVGALVYRYLRKTDPVGRQQTKWVVFGITTGVGGIIVVALLGIVFPALGPPSLFDVLGVRSAQILLLLLIPLSIGLAILRYRLWDIDVIINRTLVYGALTACVVGIYVFIVGYLGAVFRVNGSLTISLVATGVVAVLFAPLRDRLQRSVNHLMYGERDEPYAVLSRLGQRLEGTLAPGAVLPAIVETVAGALRLPYAAISLRREKGFETATEYGTPSGEPLVLPLAYQNELVGKLVLAPRSPSEQFTAQDRRLLDDLARQIGVAAYAVLLNADLQRSRERLVTAREEERRRLRRDFHDGIGPQLAALTLELETARNKLSYDPIADALMDGLAGRTAEITAEVRRSVHGLRPPALDELGLIPTLREIAAQYGQNALSVRVEAPEDLPPLPATVEVAAYRIAHEAMTNVVRHAGANECAVRIALEDDTLSLDVTDNGRGVGAECGTGVGLHSMRERAEELGG
ncbi:MAG: histidine kinase, partial [Actinomycetota bacterium]|nr:histidine kinase [Actinomycetota bacterium]